MTKEDALEILYLAVDRLTLVSPSSRRKVLLEETRSDLIRIIEALERKNSFLRKELGIEDETN